MGSPLQRRLLAGAVTVLLCLLPGPADEARASDGHFLRSVGAVDTAMGGARIAYPGSLLGVFFGNPAGLSAFDGTRFEVGFGFVGADHEVASGFGGPLSSRDTASDDGWAAVPAIAFSRRVSDRVVVGIAGFWASATGVDYPRDLANAVLRPQPFGLGAAYSRHTQLELRPSIAWEISDRLSFGASAMISHYTLALDPALFAAPAASVGPGGLATFYSSARDSQGAFGAGLEIGLLYRAERWSLGFSYGTPIWYQTMEFASTYANPARDDFGMARVLEYRFNAPATAGFGAAFTPSDRLVLAADARRIFYGKTVGFELEDPAAPFAEDGAVAGFGWKGVWSFALGGELGVTDRVDVRAGYSHTDDPVGDGLALFSVQYGAVVRDRLSLGLGVAFEDFDLDVAYARGLDSHQEGPLWNLSGPVPGSFVRSSGSEDRLLMQLTFRPGSGDR